MAKNAILRMILQTKVAKGRFTIAVIKFHVLNYYTGTNEVSGTSEFLLFGPRVRFTGGWQMEFEEKSE